MSRESSLFQSRNLKEKRKTRKRKFKKLKEIKKNPMQVTMLFLVFFFEKLI